MSHSTRIAALTTVVWFLPLPALAQFDARKVIEQAATAHGGIETLTKYPAAKVKAKGTYVPDGQPSPCSSESVYWLPDRVHSKLDICAQRNSQTIEQIQNGERTALIVAGLMQHMSDAQAHELKMSLYCRDLGRLAPLLSDSKYVLAAAGTKDVQGRATKAVRVSRTGFQPVTLYFDPESHLLVAMERPGFDAKGGKVDQQEEFSDFKQVAGIKYPSKTKVRQKGQVVLESEVTEFTPLEQVDPKAFAIPQ